MASEDEIKNRLLQQRMDEMQQQAAMQQMQEQQAREIIKIITSKILDAKARERLNNLKVVKPEIAMQLEMYLAQLYQLGQLQCKITDEQMVMILKKLSSKPDFRIKRR